MKKIYKNASWDATKIIYGFKYLLFISCMFMAGSAWGQSTANYAFTTNTTGSLALDANGNAVDMTTGTTQLIAAGNDDLVSSLSNIGFNFIAMGNIYTQFSATSNGVMGLNSSVLSSSSGTTNGGTSAITWIAPFGGDQATNSTGKVHFKIVGSAPNRCLVVEWLNMELNFSSSTADGTYQARFYETSGVIEFVYGSMNVVSTFGTAPIIGFSGGTTSTKIASITSSSNTVSTSGTSFSVNTYSAGAIANLNSTTNGSRRAYRFTPTFTSIAGPTNLTFASVTATGMTLNWTAASPTTGIVRYIVQRSTDGGVTYPVSTNVALGTNTLAVTGLSPGTNYTYRVVAVSEGVESAAITGSQTTTAGATYYWVGASGGTFATLTNWNTAANGTGTTPTVFATTDVYIIDGAGTTAGSAVTINVGATVSVGQLKVTSNTACVLQSSATTQRIITVTGGGGDDLVIESGSTLNLNNTTNSISIVFSGTGNTGDISGSLTVAGTSTTSTAANSFLTTGGTNTVVTVSSTGIINNIATSNISTNGNITGSASSLIFANGSQYNVSGATTGAPWIPLATWGATSTVNLSGLTTSITPPTNASQTFGNLTINCPLLTASHNWASSATIQGNLNVTTGSGNFRLVSTVTATVNGNVVVNAGSFTPFSSTGSVIVLGNTTIASGATLDLSAGSGTYSQRGSTFTNNGTLTGGGATTGGTLQMFSPSNAAMTLAGTGTVSSALTTLSVQSTGGLTISHTNQIPVLRTNLFTGTITNSNKITMGTGLALAVTFQTGSTNNGGTFDQSPTWNLGTGTYSLIYSQELGNRTTGFEIPPTRTVNNITNSNSNGITINGGALTSAALTLSSGCGNITTSGANILRITGTITRTSTTAYINGPLELTLPASLTGSSVYLFPIGKSLLKPFELTTPITTAGGTVVVRAEVFDGNSGGTAGNIMGSISANRYWEASIISGAANYTSSHIRLTDTTTGFDAIGGSSTLTGAYDLIGGSAATVSATSITTVTPVPTTLLGFYCMGAKAAATLSNLTISPSGNLCTNAVRDITVTATPGGGAVTGVTLNYSINGVAQTAINMTNTSGNDWTGQIPVVSPTNANVTWSVTATDANLLTKSATGTAYKDEPNFGATATATASPSTLCTGSNTSLSYSVSSLGTGVIGSGSTNSSLSPTPFSGSYGGMKGQYIILASELIAAGYSAGNITSIGINFASATTVTYTDLTIQIGNTSLTAFNSTLSLESGLTTVYGPTSLVNPPAGVLLFNLVSPFNWNGTSNIIISTSWSNNTTTSTSASVVTTTTSTNLAQVHKRDSYTPAALLALTGTQSAGSSTVGTARPNFTLIGNKSLAPSSYSWSDGSATIGTTNPLSTTVSGNTTYTCTATVNSCPMTASTSVNTNVSALSVGTFSATKTTLCSGILDTFTGTFSGGCPPYDVVIKNPSGISIYTVTDTVGLGFFKSLNLTATGNYTLEITDNAGTLASQSVSITVNSLPVVSVSPASASSCGGKVVQLDASPSGASSYKWSVTGSTTSATGLFTTLAATTAATTATANGATTYAKPTSNTSYTVTVTDANGCSATGTKAVNVYNALTAIATTDAQALCPGSGATLKDSASMNLGVANYVFASSTGASLDPMTGATSLLASAIDNTASSITTFPSGFVFPYDGINFTQFTISDNGVLRLGNTSVASTQYGSIVGLNNLLTPFGCDMGTGSNGGVSYVLTGTSPNRIFVIDYKTAHTWSTSNPINNNYQVWLYENGTIEYRYGLLGSTGTPSFGVGICGSSTSNYISIATATGLKSNTTVTNNATLPVSGTMFSFTPSTPSYTYSWSQNGTSTLSSNSGSTVSVTNFSNTESFYVTATETTSGCSEIDTVEIVVSNGAPNITSMNSSAGTTICYGTTTTLSATIQDGCGPFTYSWDDGSGNTFTTATISVSPSVTTNYTLVITDAQNQTATNNIQVDVTNPMPTITNRSKCTTSDTFKLSATAANSGDSLYWYTVSTGGTSVGVGSTYTTPTISTAGTTTYYVEEASGIFTANGFSGTLSSSGLSSERGLVIVPTSNFKLRSLKIRAASGTNSGTVRLLDSATNTVISTTSFTSTLSAVGFITVNLNYSFEVGKKYKLLTLFSSGSGYNITTGVTYPYSISTVGSITRGITSSGINTFSSTEYSFMQNFEIQTGCTGQRVPITVTVSTPPSISLSVTSSSVCEGLNDTLSVSSSNTNYTYSWSNSVNGSSNIVAPTSSTIYSVSATDASTGCSAIASTAISVIKKPTSVSAVLSNDTVCLGSTVTLSASATNTNTIFNEDFEGSFPTANWTYINNGTGNSWITSSTAKSGSKAIQYTYNASNAADAWAITPSINMVAGNTYDIRFYYKVYNASYPEKLKVTIGTGSNVVSQSNVLWDNNGGASLTNTSYALGVASYSPTTTGTYYLGFNCYSDPNEYYLYIDSISILETSSLTYAWISTPAGFTSAVQNPTSVQDTANKIFNLTVTNSSGCKSYASDTFNVIKSSQNITLASSSVSGAVEQCTESNGWTYYSHPSTPDKLLFGIYKNGNNFTATVDITVDNVNSFRKNTTSNGANQEHASYIMSRYWNVNATGTVGSGVKVRFFIDPQDITDLLDERDNDYNVLKNTTNTSTLAVKGGFEWFKTTNTVYNPTNWTGNKHNGAIVKLTEDAVATLNGQTYVELSGITSFSGGSGGSSFGPSSNGLFNTGGTVGLPVTWKDVKATVKEEGNLIQWTTSSEKNTSHFEVEYSYDAKNFFKAFNDIKAAVNSTTDKSYDFMHLEEYGELVYYRIKQVDLDGKVDYSKIVITKRSSKQPDFKVAIYPIPLMEGELKLDIQSVAQTEIQIRVIDLLGKEVYREKIASKGYRTLHQLQLDHLPRGSYQIQVDNSVFSHQQRLVLLK